MNADNGRRHFSQAEEIEAEAAGSALPTARMLLANGVPAERMALIRWDRLRPLLGARWAEVEGTIFKLVFSHARKLLGQDAVCQRFDDCSVLLVVAGIGADDDCRAKVESLAAALRRTLFGALRRDELIEVWAVRAASEEGLACERHEPSGETAPARAEPPAPPAAPHHSVVLGDTDFSYVPVWEVRRNFVFFYACEPFWALPDGGIGREGDLADQFTSPSHVLALDCEVLRNTAEVLADVMEHDRMAQVLVPVHYSTLAGERAASRYAGEVRQAAFELKERAYFEIVGVPADVDAEQFAGIVAGLRGLCRDVCVRIDFGHHPLPMFAAARVFAVGLALRADNRREAEIIADLEGFAARAATANLHSYVHGIRTTSLGVAATCSGIDYVGTEALTATLEGCALDDYVIKPIDLYKRISRKRT